MDEFECLFPRIVSANVLYLLQDRLVFATHKTNARSVNVACILKIGEGRLGDCLYSSDHHRPPSDQHTEKIGIL